MSPVKVAFAGVLAEIKAAGIDQEVPTLGEFLVATNEYIEFIEKSRRSWMSWALVWFMLFAVNVTLRFFDAGCP